MKPLLVGLAIAVGVWLAFVAFLFLAGRRAAAREMAAFLPNLILLFRGLSKDRRVPRGSKLLILFGLVWFLSPIDLIPEFIPVAGPLDDAIVAALILRRVLRSAGKDVLAEHWRGSPETLEKLIRVTGVTSSGRDRVPPPTPSSLSREHPDDPDVG
jgi:uncharacterized membrane protein YkvA (DUF1232 family)